MINLYSTGCPKCKVLEAKLKQKGINFNIVTDINILQEKNILSVPVLEINAKLYNFVEAVNFVNNCGGIVC